MTTLVRVPAALFPTQENIPTEFRPTLDDSGQRYLMGGTVRVWTGACQDVNSPICVHGANGPQPVPLGRYPLMDEGQALEALDSACRAYGNGRGEWPTMSVADRIRHVEGFVGRMQARRDEVVRLIMWEIAKPLPDARKEFDRTLDYIRATVEALKDLDRRSSQFAIDQGFLAQIRRSPLGVVLCMGPFNYPLNETFTTLIPALIMGNAVIFKPPKLGVLLHAPLLKAFAESFPPGVVNTVYGDGKKVVGPLLTSGRIDVLAFIGSARVASLLKHQHPNPHRLRCVLGLEAKNAAVVLPDAELDQTAAECVLGAFSFNGQRCTAIKVIFAHKDVAGRLATMLADATDNLTVGMPWEKGVQITPLAEENKPAWLATLVSDAIKHGARVMNSGGGTIDHSLYYPAIVYPVATQSQLCQVEQFGPVLPIVPYADVNEVIDWITRSPFGQQVSLFGRNPDTLSQLIDPLVNQVSRVNLNSQCQRGPDTFPFTGRKESAEGTLSVSDALRVFSIRSLVAAKITDANREIVSRIVSERRSKFLTTDFIL